MTFVPGRAGEADDISGKSNHVARAIDYVLFGQGDIPDFND